jgi:hypothetical protein
MTVTYKIDVIGPTPNFLAMLQHFQIKVAAYGSKTPKSLDFLIVLVIVVIFNLSVLLITHISMPFSKFK